MGYRIGIDLGTTNSAVAYTANGRRECALIDPKAEVLGGKVVPSCIGIAPGGQIVVGQVAKMGKMSDQVREFKRGIGKGLAYELGGKLYSSLDLSAFLLARIREAFESTVGEIEGAVITVPANYLDAQRREVYEAAARAGLNVLRLINEPSAAAIAYSVSERKPSGIGLVVDWGGGTLDVSLVDCDTDVLDVLASDGDAENGGKDLDQAMFDLLLRKYASDFGPLRGDRVSENWLRLECERIKIALSSQDRWDEPVVIKEKRLFVDVEITRAEAEAVFEPWVERVIGSIQRVLKKAPQGAVGPADVHDVMLVGGSCYLPLLRRRIQSMFGRPGRTDVNPMEVVALGAAYQADHAHTTGALTVLHSTATNLGMSCVGIDSKGVPRDNLFSVIIPTATKVPARRTETYFTVRDDEDSVMLHVLEGEGETTEGCVVLDVREIAVPLAKAAAFPINVTFDYDIQQMLRVTVEIPGRPNFEWVLPVQQRLVDGRAESRVKLDGLVDEGLKPFVELAAKVRDALPPYGADASRAALESIKQALQERNMDKTTRCAEKLRAALFDDGINA